MPTDTCVLFLKLESIIEIPFLEIKYKKSINIQNEEWISKWRIFPFFNDSGW